VKILIELFEDSNEKLRMKGLCESLRGEDIIENPQRQKKKSEKLQQKEEEKMLSGNIQHKILIMVSLKPRKGLFLLLRNN